MEPLPELYDIFKGEVANVTEYGAFIKIPGCRKQGLVHRTHMSACRVDNPSEIVDVGEKVWVKVIGKEETDGKLKLSLSMKVVNQGTGKDQDPNNVILDQEDRKKREFRDFSKQKITLEAVLNTVCQKCGCKGHFAKDCYVQPGGTKYSLVPEVEEEEEEEQPAQPNRLENSAKKRKKDKKAKKKKHKEMQLSSESEVSDTSDSDSDTAISASKRRRHEEKHKKSKKKKHKKEKHRESKKTKCRN